MDGAEDAAGLRVFGCLPRLAGLRAICIVVMMQMPACGEIVVDGRLPGRSQGHQPDVEHQGEGGDQGGRLPDPDRHLCGLPHVTPT